MGKVRTPAVCHLPQKYRAIPCWLWPHPEPGQCEAQHSELETTLVTVAANPWVHTVPTLPCPASGDSEPWGASGLGAQSGAGMARVQELLPGGTGTQDSARGVPPGPVDPCYRPSH